MDNSTTTPKNARTKQTPAARSATDDFIGQDADNTTSPTLQAVPGCAPAGLNLPPVWSGSAADLAANMADTLTRRHGAEPVFARGSLWGYDKARGLWTPLERHGLQSMLASWEGRPVGQADPETGKVKRLRVNNIHTPIEILEAQHALPDYFDGPVGLSFADLYLTTELTPTVRRIVTRAHSPDNRATHGYPFRAPRPAVALDAPAFRAYLKSLFAGAEDDQQRIALLGEWFGLALLGLSTRFNKALLLYGPGGSGKGTFLTILKAVFPQDSVASADPEHWGRGPVMAELAGKRLNLVSDMNHAYDMAEIGRFKAVVSGDLILAEQKYRDPFSFNPVAGHVFSANEDQLPGVPKADPAFWQRWVCVPFTNVFRDTARDDRGMAERIIGQEQEAIVQWLLSSAAVALEANALTSCQSGEAVVAEWRGGICSVSLWFHECTREWQGGTYRRAPDVGTVYSDYRAYCAEGGYTPASRNIFTKRLRAISPDAILRSNGVRLLREWHSRAWSSPAP